MTYDEISRTRTDKFQDLCQLASDLGYRSSIRQLINNNGSCVSDLIDLLEDNPGCVEVMIEWLADQYGQCEICEEKECDGSCEVCPECEEPACLGCLNDDELSEGVA